MTENEFALSEADLRALRELKNSRGWAIVMETTKDSILEASLQFADNPLMTEKEIDFRRGAISASRNFVNVPDLLISKLEAGILMAAAEKQSLQPLNATA